MAQPTAYIDKRFTPNGRKSQIKLDNNLSLHGFINDWIKNLPQYANNAAATTAGLNVGDLYINTGDAVVPVVAVVV